MSLSVDYNGVSVSFDESDVTEELSVINCHDSDVIVMGYDTDGNEYEAIGCVSCDELVEIYEDSVMSSEEAEAGEEYLEWLLNNNPDDGSWEGR